MAIKRNKNGNYLLWKIQANKNINASLEKDSKPK